MYYCPYCSQSQTLYVDQELKMHVKNHHKHEGKSGHCPVLNCTKTFGSLYNYIVHVNKCHVLARMSPGCDSIKRKNSSDVDNRKNKIARTSTPNNEFQRNDDDDVSNINNSNISYQILSEDQVTNTIQNFNDFDDDLNIDSKLSKYKEFQINRALNVVKELNATVTLPRADIYRIISLFDKFQKASIEGLRDVDPEISKNKKINVALKFFESSFSDINTEHKTFKHLMQKDALVRPTSKIIDISMKPVIQRNTGRISYSPVSTTIQFVPMDLVLKKYLELPNIFNVIIQSLTNNSDSDRVDSVIQGSSWKKFKSQNRDKLVIPLSIYFDDFEINNPLGAHKKQIGGVYYTISCIPSQFSSKLENWFLSQFHYEKDFKKFGTKKVFGKLRNELLKLKTRGIDIEVEGITHHVFFQVARLIGDNLGFNQLLGFASFSAHNYCRICMLPSIECKKSIVEDKKMIRNKINYKIDVKNSVTAIIHSRGVKEECVFHPLFHVCDIITVDPFHDFEEGICRYEIPSIIHLLMKEKSSTKFSVDDINNNIKMLNFFKARDKTIPIIKEESIRDKYLVLNGSEMSLVIEYLGIVIGKYVPRENKTWQLYILLRQIYFLVMAPSFTWEDVEMVDILVEKHHRLYLSLDLGDLKPKHHFLLHYSRAMKMMGPLRYNSSIRGEAVHRNSKRYARVANSRVNPCYTLAVKYQLVLAKRFYDSKPMISFHSERIKQTTQIKNLKDYSEFEAVSPVLGDKKIEVLSEIDYDGTVYKTNMTVVLEIVGDLPMFGEIKLMLKDENEVYFAVKKLQTLYLDKHVQAYIVDDTKEWLFVQKEQLLDYMPSYPQIVHVPSLCVTDNDLEKINTSMLEKKKVIVRTYI